MITYQEIIKTVLLGAAIVWTFKKLNKPKKWNEIVLIRKL